MNDPRLPFHPTIPDMQALGFTRRGRPIWPVMGGSQPIFVEPSAAAAGGAADGDGGDSASRGAGGSDGDRGFPSHTAVKDMTAEQQAAYWRHYDRQKSDRLRAYDGITPEDAKRYRNEADQRRRDGLKPDERALEDARREGQLSASQTAASQWAPELAEEIAARFITDEAHRRTVMAGIDPMRFVADDGKFNRQGLIDHLAGLQAAFGGGSANASGGSAGGSGAYQPSQWGQGNGRSLSRRTGSDEGTAEAKRRGYTKD